MSGAAATTGCGPDGSVLVAQRRGWQEADMPRILRLRLRETEGAEARSENARARRTMLEEAVESRTKD